MITDRLTISKTLTILNPTQCLSALISSTFRFTAFDARFIRGKQYLTTFAAMFEDLKKKIRQIAAENPDLREHINEREGTV